MFKTSAIVVLCVVLACSLVEAKPAVLAAPVVTATSSQYVSRNFNGIAAAPIVAPVASAAYTSPIAAAYTAPVAAAYTTPVAAAYSAYSDAFYPYAADYTTVF